MSAITFVVEVEDHLSHTTMQKTYSKLT